MVYTLAIRTGVLGTSYVESVISDNAAKVSGEKMKSEDSAQRALQFPCTRQGAERGHNLRDLHRLMNSLGQLLGLDNSFNVSGFQIPNTKL